MVMALGMVDSILSERVWRSAGLGAMGIRRAAGWGMTRYILRGISRGRAARYIRVMRVAGVWVWLGAGVLLIGANAWGSVTLRVNPKIAAGKLVAANRTDDARTMRESLRRDVAQHPDDFIVFATEAGAKEFYAEHSDEEEQRNQHGKR